MRQSLYIGVVVALQLLATFVTQLLIVRLAGINSDTDAYIAAQAVPAVIFAIVTSVLQSVWLPRLSLVSSDPERWRKEQSISQGQAFIMGGGILFILWLGASWWLPIVFPGLSSEQVERTLSFMGPLLIATALNTQAAMISIGLRATNRFLAAEIVSMVGAFTTLFFVFLMLPQYGLKIVPWVLACRAIAVYVIQLKLAEWPTICINEGFSSKETWRLMRPLLCGASIYKTSPLVDRFWASQAPLGGLTVLNLAQSLMAALSTIIERSICMPITPKLSRFVAANDYNAVRNAYRVGVKNVTLAVGLFAALLLITYNALATVVMGLFHVDTETAFNILLICFFLLGYLHVAASGTIVVAVYYAMGDTKTPVKIGISGFLIGILLKSAGFLMFSLPGLAFAISAYYIINMVTLCFIAEKTLDEKIARY